MDTKLARSAPTTELPPATRHAAAIVRRVFRDYDGGIHVRFWDGHAMTVGSDPPRFTLVFRDPGKFRGLMLRRDPLYLAEAHIGGHVDVEGSIYDALQLKEHLQSLRLSAAERAAILTRLLAIRSREAALAAGLPGEGRRNWRAQPSGRHSRHTDQQAITFHYDLSNDFYALWLDRQMVYSCAYFESPEDSLEQAQRNKFEHICRKLRLRPGETLLDIGCGWGGLLRWAARHYGVKAHGITLSQQQFEYARRRIQEDGLDGRVLVELRDYRDMPTSDQFDKIVSVGMFEHVGIRNLPAYFRTAHRLLKPGGLFLNHGITSDRLGTQRTVATRFIDRYVFPDSELEAVSKIQRVMETAGFEILDVESLRPHYALTLRHWVHRLEKRRQEAVQQVGEATYRIWRLYMAGCALQFEAGDMSVYQILLGKCGKGFLPVPLTRRDLYPPRRQSASQ